MSKSSFTGIGNISSPLNGCKAIEEIANGTKKPDCMQSGFL
jgi:hypothetical protein